MQALHVEKLLVTILSALCFTAMPLFSLWWYKHAAGILIEMVFYRTQIEHHLTFLTLPHPLDAGMHECYFPYSKY